MSYDGVGVGYLTTRVMTWWTPSGRFLARRKTNPIERADWLIYWTQQPSWCSMPFLDGVMHDVDAESDEWARGEFSLLGRTLAVEWLSGTEAARLLAEYPVPSDGPGD